MIHAMLLTTAAVSGVVSVTGMAVPTPLWLQYGALGLCALMIVMNYADRKSMTQRLDHERDVKDVLAKSTLGTMNRLCSVMESKPCLASDSVLGEIRDMIRSEMQNGNTVSAKD